jgi:hypothetical protein
VNNEQAFVDSCNLFSSGRMGRFKVVSQPVHVTDVSVQVEVSFEGVSQFGIAEVVVYSVNKAMTSKTASPQVLAKDSATPQKQAVPQDKESDLTVAPPVQQPYQQIPEIAQQNTLEPDTPMKVSASASATTVQSSTNITNFMPVPNQIRFDSDEDAYSEHSNYAITSAGTLQLSIKDVPIIQGLLMVEINALSPNDYQLLSNYYSEDYLIVVLNISKNFRNAVVTVKEVSMAGRLVAGQTQIVARVEVSRYDAYSEQTLNSIASFGVLFSVISWMAVIAMLIAILTGFGVVTEEHIIALQILYLHVYIGYNMLPLSFRDSVSNLRTVGFLHFFPEAMVQSEWSLNPEAMYELAPHEFSFFYAFLPIFSCLILFTLWFLVLVALKKWFLPYSIPDESRSPLHKLADRIVCRWVNFIDSIWRYQFIAIILICVMQFIARGPVSAIAMASIVMLLIICWSVGSEFYIRNQYYENEYSEFIYQFEDRYYCKIPLHALPSRHHRLGYPLIRVSKSLLFVLIVALVKSPISSLFLLIALHGFEFWYILHNQIYSDKRMLKFRML